MSVIVYLADIDDWGRFNTAYKELMPTPYPTRTALGANLRGILVEISAVAYVGVRRERSSSACSRLACRRLNEVVSGERLPG